MKKELRQLLCPDVDCQHGAPMGRSDIDKFGRTDDGPIRDVCIPLNSQGYDAGGAYWGIGAELRCRFIIGSNGELVLREFYRKER